MSVALPLNTSQFHRSNQSTQQAWLLISTAGIPACGERGQECPRYFSADRYLPTCSSDRKIVDGIAMYLRWRMPHFILLAACGCTMMSTQDEDQRNNSEL
jgi:hypothetical protein